MDTASLLTLPRARLGIALASYHHMPRKARALPGSAMLHIIGRGNSNVKVFKNRRDFREFKRHLIKCLSCTNLMPHNYAIMTTHYHLLLWSENTKEVAPFIKSLHVTYHHYYQRKYNYRGHLWHSRYRSIIIDNDTHLTQCGRYVELNPVHAGICTDPKDYPWTSYHHYGFGKDDKILRPVLYGNGTESADKRQREYRKFVIAGINMEYQALKKQFENEKNQNCQSSLRSR